VSDRDPYLVLRIPPTATPEQIKTAYRAMSKRYHPDLNQDIAVAAQEKMTQCTSAYQILSNKERRDEYDQQPHFKVRVPKGFSANINTRTHLEKPSSGKPGLFDKLLGFFVKVEPKPTKDPAAARTHFTMGLTLTDQESFYPDAREEFQRAMQADPDSFEAAFNYGLMSYKTGEFEEARVGFQKASRIKPQDRYSRLLLDLLRPEDIL